MHSIACLFFIFQAQNNKKTSKKQKLEERIRLFFAFLLHFKSRMIPFSKKLQITLRPKTRKPGKVDNIRQIFLGGNTNDGSSWNAFFLCAATHQIFLRLLFRAGAGIINCRLNSKKENSWSSSQFHEDFFCLTSMTWKMT